MNLHLFICLLNSYTDIPINDPEFQKIINEEKDNKTLYSRKFNIESLKTLNSVLMNAKLNIISSYPGRGKTWLALTFAKHMAVNLNKPVAFISLEISKKTLCERIYKIDCDKLFDFKDGPDFISYPPFDVADNSNMTFSEIKEYIKDLHSKKKIEIVFIDSINALTKGKQESDEISEQEKIITELNVISVELNISIIVTLQEPENTGDIFCHLIDGGLFFDMKRRIDNLVIIQDFSLDESMLAIYKYSDNLEWTKNQTIWKFPYEK